MSFDRILSRVMSEFCASLWHVVALTGIDHMRLNFPLQLMSCFVPLRSLRRRCARYIVEWLVDQGEEGKGKATCKPIWSDALGDYVEKSHNNGKAYGHKRNVKATNLVGMAEESLNHAPIGHNKHESR